MGNGAAEAPQVQTAGGVCWRRLLLAIRVVGAETPIPATIDFLFNNVLDFLDPQHVAVWHASENGAYRLLHEVGQGKFMVPGGLPDWASVNREVVISGGPMVWLAGDASTDQLRHVAVPSVQPGACYLVLHVVLPAEQNQACDDLLLFLSSVAALLQNAVRYLSHADSGNGKTEASSSMLTERQLSILALLRSDKTYREIASELGFSESTIKADAVRIFEKLQVSDRRAAVAAAEADRRFDSPQSRESTSGLRN